jgi:hypothetical protein
MNSNVINLDMGNPLRVVKQYGIGIGWSEEIVDLAIRQDSSTTEVLWLSPFVRRSGFAQRLSLDEFLHNAMCELTVNCVLT